jgi:REP element-mobilizing transposase RayT
MQETLQKFDGERYRLIAWCIMPNHVHVLIEPLVSLPRIVQSWKSFTGRWALLHNAELGLGVPGHAFWMWDYWDRYIRNEKHLQAVIDYIHENPVAAGLCDSTVEWPWSSAYIQA